MNPLNIVNSFAVYDCITIIYIVVGIACFIWTSIGNDYVFNKIDKLIKTDKNLDQREKKCDLYYVEIRKSWMRNQNIWISVEYFLVGLAYINGNYFIHNSRQYSFRRRL